MSQTRWEYSISELRGNWMVKREVWFNYWLGIVWWKFIWFCEVELKEIRGKFAIFSRKSSPIVFNGL